MKMIASVMLVALTFISIPVVVFLGVTGAFLFGAVLALKRLGRSVAEVTTYLTCSIDADCPQGYICRDGTCMPAE